MTMASTTRLASLDALRGFDMLFIMGGGASRSLSWTAAFRFQKSRDSGA